MHQRRHSDGGATSMVDKLGLTKKSGAGAEPEGRIYWAGPGVFFKNATELCEAMKAAATAKGMKSYHPWDNGSRPDVQQAFVDKDGDKAAELLSEYNEGMIDECVANGSIGFIIADCRPWRGSEADDGTAYELGYARKAGCTLICYTNDERKFEDRVIEGYGGKDAITTDPVTGVMRGPDGNMVEAFGGEDNLMLTHGAKRSGGRFIVGTWKEALDLAQALYKQKKAELASDPMRHVRGGAAEAGPSAAATQVIGV